MWMMKKYRSLGLIAMALIIFIAAACGDGRLPQQQQNGQPDMRMKAESINQNNPNLHTDSTAHIAFTSLQGKEYISANELVNVLQYHSEWDADKQIFRIGDNDVVYELTMNNVRAVKEEQEITLPQPPVLADNTVYIPVSAIADLFQEEMVYEIKGNQMIISPSLLEVNDQMDQGAVDEQVSDDLQFADDPNDPFKSDETDNAGNTDIPAIIPQDDQAIPAAKLKNININGLISTARKYMGVKYKFNAGSYPSTKRFDCSSYTKYVFGKYGINLPRVSRNQAKLGNRVSRKSLRKGDLLYFYVPGRFKTNKTVGHVGIYIGNMNMIHSSPSPKNGVQITNINKAYWKRTFLGAKRIAY